jgi:hypothetical protein
MSRITPRVAIVGSCITRDLWPIHGGGAQALLYVSRTGLPSLLAAPVQGFHPDRDLPGDLHRHEHNAALADLQKTALARLVAFAPTHVIFDFIDERFDLLSAGRSIVTHSAELARSGYLDKPAFREARRIPRLSAACEQLWSDAVGEFAALVRATPLSRASLILHAARWAAEQRMADGSLVPLRDVEILHGLPAEIADYNGLLARQEAAFEALMPPMAKVDASAHRLADPHHRWGLSPFHYVPEYYVEVRRQLEALGLADAFSDRLAAPSAPAA